MSADPEPGGGPDRGAAVADWWPWLVLPVAASALVGAGLALVAAYSSGSLDNEAAVNVPLAVGFSTVAAGIWSTRPHPPGLTRLGILFTVVGLGSALTLPAYGWGASPHPGAHAMAWLSTWVWTLGAPPLMTLGLLLYPDGELPSRRWWPAVAAGVGGNLALLAAGVFRPGPLDGHERFDNPVGLGTVPGWEAVGSFGFPALMAGAVSGLAALVVRFVRAPRGDVRRRQVGGLILAGALVVVAASLPPSGGAGTMLLAVVTGTVLPATVGLAVVRHRLLDGRTDVAQLRRRVGDLAASRRSLVSDREEERARLRRELHDGLGPSLAAIGLGLRRLEQEGSDATGAVRDLADEVQRAVGEVRRLCDGLRPPAISELGLAGALRAALEPLERFGPSVELVDHGLPGLPPAVEVAAYRIGMEAATNAVRHAEASRVSVALAYDDGLSVEVLDDGCGIDPGAPRGVGLDGMAARAEELGGTLVVEPVDRGGTRVRAWLPREAT